MTALDAPLRATGFSLTDWQEDAVAAWVQGDGEPYRGTLEIFTGGGKTLIAIACMARAAATTEDLKVAVVVPTEALARQWIDSLVANTSLAEPDIGLLGAGGTDSLEDARVLVCVLNTAAKRLPGMARTQQPLMLVVDECHRAGAQTFSRVLTTQADFRLGLSATPLRDEWDDAGQPIGFDEQIVGRALGKLVYRFSLKDAQRIDWLPTFTINHHGLELHDTEQGEYSAISRTIDDVSDQLKASGVDVSRAREFQKHEGEIGELAGTYVGLTAKRKDLLYRASERTRVAVRLVCDAIRDGKQRILIFHERVAEADDLFQELVGQLEEDTVVREHSKLPDSERKLALQRFRSGDVRVLVSVRSLIEGIDVPDADVGISVASSTSVRQRIQALGRVLRRSFAGGPEKEAAMHVLYIADTVDAFIYAKEDWADLTGEANNLWWHWSLDPSLPPEAETGPPHTPRPSEDQEWERLGGKAPDEPTLWLGSLPAEEYSVDTLGTVRNTAGTTIMNAQGTPGLVAELRGRPGGRLWITPKYHLVIMFLGEDTDFAPYVIGQLAEPFAAVDAIGNEDVDVAELSPGDPYPGPGDSDGGRYLIRAKRGGVIERRVAGRTQFALTSDSPNAAQAANAQRVLDAWREVLNRGMGFSVNRLDHAWYEIEGERRFLAAVPDAFAWPETE